MSLDAQSSFGVGGGGGDLLEVALMDLLEVVTPWRLHTHCRSAHCSPPPPPGASPQLHTAPAPAAPHLIFSSVDTNTEIQIQKTLHRLLLHHTAHLIPKPNLFIFSSVDVNNVDLRYKYKRQGTFSLSSDLTSNPNPSQIPIPTESEKTAAAEDHSVTQV